MWKKWMALLCSLALLVGMVPSMPLLSVGAAAKDIVTITVTDQYGNLLPDAEVSVSRVYLTAGGNRRTQTVTVTAVGNGTFTYDTSIYYYGTTQYYTVTASCADCPTVSQQVDTSTRSVLIALTSTAVPIPDEWVRFDLYYIATGRTPASFTGAGAAVDYGPSGNDVPLVTINVNITKLKSAEYADRVAYEENHNGNSYHFIPAGNVDSNAALTEEQKRQFVKPFWEAVVECMDEESKEAFEATGLMDSFQGYVLKNQGTAQRPDNHCDGILVVEPPVYIVEMNDRGTYFGGMVNDQNSTNFPTIDDVLEDYNDHYKQAIEWVSNGDGTYSGFYIEDGFKYFLKVSQTNYAADLYSPVQGGEYVAYKKQTDQYYLATFDAAEEFEREKVELSVIYKDGANDKVFNKQQDDVKKYAAVPTFRGDVERENYVHIGWMLEGGDGTVLTQEQIEERYTNVTEDLTFIAVYELKPATFAGVVEVVLNGSYQNGTATGERVDIDTIKSGVGLAVSADGVNFIPLERDATGVYSAHLENGAYQIYYQYGSSYALTTEQQLVIADAPRTRYLFFNTVTYDANGGQNAPVPSLEYYQTGTAVTVSTTVPAKEGYRFLGWKDQNGALHQSGAALTAAIGEAYVLTAQWEKILYADVDVTLIIDHKEVDGGINQNRDKSLEIDLTYRPVQSAEDYVEVVGKDFFTDTWATDGTTVNNVTTVTYDALFEKLDVAHEYSANVFVSEYEVTDRTVTASTDAEGNVTYHVTVKLRFSPDQYTLKYQVVEHIANDALVPLATDIKVLTWYNPSLEIAGAPTKTMWYPIVQHVNTSHDALFNSQDTDADGNQVAYGEYLVWGWEDKEDNRPYYYRIGTVGFTLADGTELTATTADGIHFTSVATSAYPAGAYTATLVVDGGASPAGTDLDGAYFSQNGNQNGTLTLVVEAHPYTVTFDPNGGTLNGSTNDTVLLDRFVAPDMSAFVPVRGDAYVFDRWVLLDKNGNETDTAVNSFDALTRDITLKAKWKEPLTVNGLVTVGATYEQLNEDGSYSIQEIYENDRPKTVAVLLQKIDPNGYPETVQSVTLTLDYTNKEYYYQDVRAVGVAHYTFENIPDDGASYRVLMLQPNYTSFFQNETKSASIRYWWDYPTYNDTDYTVVWGTTEPKVGTVNIHNHFEPEEFELVYAVDASAIGAAFRPDSTELLITSDDQPSGYAPSEWTVISQMLINGAFVGDDVALEADGLGQGADRVWISAIDGTTYYQYGLRLYTLTTDGVVQEYTDDLPFTVDYVAPVHYHYGAQSGELKAVLTPNTYDIRYELGGGTATADYPTTHTWSYETALDLSEPTFPGFVFGGWYLDADFTVPAPEAIAADVAEDTTLYAKWVQAMDVVDLTVIIRHDLPTGGLTGNYNKTLYAQLTHDFRANEGQIDRVFMDVDGCKKEYRNGMWHTQGDDMLQDVFQVPAFYTNLSAEYDYAVNVSLDGYYVANKTVEKSAQPDGSTLHKVVVELQYSPELTNLEFYVRVDDEVSAARMPVSAEVKVTAWYDSPLEGVDLQWYRISQHASTTVTVTIDPETRIGYASYPVWVWYNKEEGIPYHYRIEPVQLNYADGSTSPMAETTDDVMYHGGGFHAEAETTGGQVPTNPDAAATTLEGVYFAEVNGAMTQQGTVGAVIGRHNSVIFHANNLDYTGSQAFRTYYESDTPDLGDDSYRLNADGTVDTFYDIPTFDYEVHNNYIFKGWYMHPVDESEPFSWDHAFEGSGDVYAHWITVGEVDKNADDTKNITGETYKEYDLVGVQIRDADLDEVHHGGQAASGLRFITVLSDRIQNEIDNLSDQPLEYGFVMAKTSTLQNYAKGEDYTLEYKHQNTNGVDTRSDYVYAQNMICSRYVDHYEGAAGTYCLYTAVITYEDTPDREAAYATDFTARSYLRYKDANGLTRVHYHNYTGASRVAHGCSTSFATVQGMMGV